ncbi:MAG: hypothetical protein ABSE73_28420 [Planctomycetota bacterium]
MKRKKEPALIEIQRRGLDALARELGPDGLIRFFQIYGLGEGDYTRDRHKWLSNTSVEGIAAKIGITKKRRQA